MLLLIAKLAQNRYRQEVKHKRHENLCVVTVKEVINTTVSTTVLNQWALLEYSMSINSP